MLKLNRLLFATAEEVFIDCIEPTKEQRQVLFDAKNDSGEDVVRIVGADRVSRPVVKSTSAG